MGSKSFNLVFSVSTNIFINPTCKREWNIQYYVCCQDVAALQSWFCLDGKWINMGHPADVSIIRLARSMRTPRWGRFVIMHCYHAIWFSCIAASVYISVRDLYRMVFRLILILHIKAKSWLVLCIFCWYAYRAHKILCCLPLNSLSV